MPYLLYATHDIHGAATPPSVVGAILTYTTVERHGMIMRLTSEATHRQHAETFHNYFEMVYRTPRRNHSAVVRVPKESIDGNRGAYFMPSRTTAQLATCDRPTSTR